MSLKSEDHPEPFSTQLPEAEKCSPWLLFALPIGIGFALAVVMTVVRVINSVDSRAIYLGLDGLRPVIFSLGAIALAGILGVYWFRPKLRTLALTCVALVAAGYGLTKLVRIESFYGNMMPRLAWSWTPTAEEQIEEYLVHFNSNADTAKVAPNVFAPTEFDFLGFLGAKRDGHVETVALSSDWHSTPPRELWRHPVGLGWSSFAVVGGAAVNLEQRGDSECVVCYDLHTGAELWSHSEFGRFEDEHGDGPRSTPTIADGLVYSMGAFGTLTCVNLETGQLVWKAATLTEPEQQNLLWGMSGSPLVAEGRVIVTPGGEASSAICYDAQTGQELWRGGDDPGGYASPLLADVCGQTQVLSFNGAGLRAFTIDGKPEWIVPWLTQGEAQRVNVAQPIVVEAGSGPHANTDGTRILISSGYGNGTALIHVSPDDGGWKTETVWHSRRLKSKMSNFIVHGDYIYGLDSGILTCISLAEGERQWKGGRYGHGQLLLINGRLLVQAESGDVVLVDASPAGLNELARFPALDGKTWNNPAIAGNILVVRNDHEAAAFELPVASTTVY